MMDESSGTAIFNCSKCGAALPDGVFHTKLPVPCERCGAESQVLVFPALVNGTSRVQYGDALETDDEASCFYHPEKRAVTACESCGRFLCSLCEIGISGRKLCPNCLELGKNDERIVELVTYRTLYDSIAWALGVWPLLIIIMTIVTAPMAIYISVRHWKSPTSILGRTKIRFILAIIIALLELGGWAGVLSLIHR